MILYYIRHGDPIYDPDSLTPLGQRQAEAVAKRLALFGVDEVYSSTSTRAIQTAQPTCELTGLSCHTMDWMHEKHGFSACSYPMDDGHQTWLWSHPKYSQLLCSREIREMGDRWYEHPAFDGLGFVSYFQRVRREADAWLASLGFEHDREKGLYKVTAKQTDKRIALFAHEGFGKVFLSEVLDVPYPYYAEHFELRHTGMTAILFDEGRENYHLNGYARARVMTLSNDSHLYRDGLPLGHTSTGMRQRY